MISLQYPLAPYIDLSQNSLPNLTEIKCGYYLLKPMMIPGSLARGTFQLSSKRWMHLGWLFPPSDQPEQPRLCLPKSLMDTFVTLPSYLPDQPKIYASAAPLHLLLRISLIDSFLPQENTLQRDSKTVCQASKCTGIHTVP